MKNEVEQMQDQCLEFGEITNIADCIKDDLQNLGDNAEVNFNTSIDAETGLEICKVIIVTNNTFMENINQLQLMKVTRYIFRERCPTCSS